MLQRYWAGDAWTHQVRGSNASANEGPVASWYPDPMGSLQLRWWDGREWTEHTTGLPIPAATNVATSDAPTRTGMPALSGQIGDPTGLNPDANTANPTRTTPPITKANVSQYDLRPEAVAKRGGNSTGSTLYWSNLLRIRFWQFTLLGSLLISGLLALIAPPLAYLIFILLPLLGWFWLRVQMACRACGRVLAVTRLNGFMDVCSKCHHPTDKALREGTA